MTPDFEENQSGFSGILMWIFAGIALFMFLGLHGLWGSESRWAETAREMAVTGDLLHPALNWEIFRFQPLLTYWLAVPFIQAMGADELAVRLPGVLMALAGLGGTYALACKVFDRQTALLSSWLLLSTYGFLFWSRSVSGEIAGMAWAVLALTWFFHAENRSAWVRFPVFYLILCAGISAKGIQLAAVPVLFLLPHIVIGKKWRSCLHPIHPVSLIVCLLLALLPFYLAEIFPPHRALIAGNIQQLSFSEFFHIENLCRIFTFRSSGSAFYSCLCNLPRLLLPWTPFFILSIGVAIINRKTLGSRFSAFLLGILLLAVYFTVKPPLRWYCILPMVPFCCIFTAAVLCSGEKHKSIVWTTYFMRWAIILAASLALASPIMLPVFQMMFKQLPPVMIVLALPLAGLTVLTVCIMDNEPGNKIEHLCGIPHQLVSTVVGAAILSATAFCIIRPGMTVYRTGKPFIKSLAPVLAGVPGKNIVFYETDAVAEFQFYLDWDEPVTLLKRGEVKSFLQHLSGGKAAFFCYSTPDVLEKLIPELASAGIDPAVLKPVRKEPGEGKKWVLFLFELPSAQTKIKTGGK